MHHFKFYNKKDVLSVTKIRRFETKLGERVQVIANPANIEASLQASSANYVVLGIPEDIGVKANGGIGGTDSAWLAFLKAFLNIQSNDFLEGSNMMVLGHFDFASIAELIDQNAFNEEEKMAAYRHAVNTIDDSVEQLIHIITQNKKMSNLFCDISLLYFINIYFIL